LCEKFGNSKKGFMNLKNMNLYQRRWRDFGKGWWIASKRTNGGNKYTAGYKGQSEEVWKNIDTIIMTRLFQEELVVEKQKEGEVEEE